MEVVKVTYSVDANQRPVAVASADKTYGSGPLTVQFTGSNSFDPEGSPLSYRWDFGDGTETSADANPQHTFQAPPSVPTRYTTTLTVTDTNGANGTMRLTISVNNTPPSVTILNPVDGGKYPLTGDTVYQLSAEVSDAEYADDQLSYRWLVILHHNDHTHSEPVDSERTPIAVVSPLGCSG